MEQKKMSTWVTSQEVEVYFADEWLTEPSLSLTFLYRKNQKEKSELRVSWPIKSHFAR